MSPYAKALNAMTREWDRLDALGAPAGLTWHAHKYALLQNAANAARKYALKQGISAAIATDLATLECVPDRK